ncbi:MAG: DNA-binding protein [Candidatus Harrisonbacteria bacterium CG10_big_fil_rev_8_21_14_0_10_45_28]|uniref:DNA-binding protein n=1 Tax=Candidatus Harrisonbacteria bacterium CG10_big_fil_rev_8_21_14_0_10_45_28 TaxID=1974586 RepID=A0A2H0UN76_9BACT|nr:MAG: DNA-binding protein [Candidatus Harrisonbacteria bacterium CG10_big_fil_rev_8_21_14_0_10_45_28]
MTDASKKLATNMKKIRARKKMSQGDICRALGVDRAYISTIESGKQNPTLATVEKIAQALGVSVNELLK